MAISPAWPPSDHLSKSSNWLRRLSDWGPRLGIQVRSRHLPARDISAFARAVRHHHQGSVFVNSRADVALAVGAHGVHLPAQGLSTQAVRTVVGDHAMRIGRSTHSLEEIVTAHQEGVDYVIFGPVFETPSKAGWAAQGLAKLREACRLGPPVFAIGGIDLERAHAAIEVGAWGVAGIRLFEVCWEIGSRQRLDDIY